MAHEPLRSASLTRRGVESDSSRQIGTGSTRASCACGHEVGRRQRLLDAQDVEIGEAAQPCDVLSAGPEGPVGVDLEHEVGMVGPHGAHGLELPARLDLQPHAGRAGVHRGGHLGPQRRQVVVLRDADDGADGHGLETLLDPQGVGQRAPLGPQFGVRDGHLEGCRQHAIGRRAPEQLRHLGTAGAAGRPAPAGLAQARHAPLDRGPLHLVERWIDRGAAGEGGALAPPFAVFGDHVHEEQRAQRVHARCRCRRRCERGCRPGPARRR